MKRILLLLLITLFISCSNDDGPAAVYQNEHLTGTWGLEKISVNGTNIPLDECTRQEKIIVEVAGIATEYKATTENSPCEFLETEFEYDINGTVISIESIGDIRFNGYILSDNRIEVKMTWNDVKSTSTYVRR